MAAARTPRVLLLLASWFLIVACGGGNATSPVKHQASTTSLPLQKAALEVGGDVQNRATDVVQAGLTKKQLDDISRACSDTVGVVAQGDDCITEGFATAIPDLLPTEGPGTEVPYLNEPCGPALPFCLHVRVFAPGDQQVFGEPGYLEVTEEDPGRHTCGTEPTGVCMRLGASTAAALGEVAHTTLPTTPTPATTTPPTTTPPTTPTPPTTASTAPSTATGSPTTSGTPPPATTGTGRPPSSSGATTTP